MVNFYNFKDIKDLHPKGIPINLFDVNLATENFPSGFGECYYKSK